MSPDDPTIARAYEAFPNNTVVLTTTARGSITIDVKVSHMDPEVAADKAVAIFERLRAKFKDVNETNAEFYKGKG